MVGAQRRKARSASPKKKKSVSYFKRKAGSTSMRKRTTTAAKKRTARVVRATKRTTRSVRASAKRVSRAARASTRRVVKTARRKVKRATIRASRAAVKTSRPSSVISKFFLSSDMANERVPSVASVYKKAFQKRVEVTNALNTGLKGRQKRSRLSRFEVMRRNLMVLVRRMLSWFSSRSYNLNMTLSGRRALSQLEDLYDLLILEAMDDESLLKLKVAYGEACYYVTQASRGYQKKHSGHGRENYSPYFDRFVDSSGI